MLDESHEEIRALARDALEDAVLAGCDGHQARRALHGSADALENPYAEDSA